MSEEVTDSDLEYELEYYPSDFCNKYISPIQNHQPFDRRLYARIVATMWQRIESLNEEIEELKEHKSFAEDWSSMFEDWKEKKRNRY